MDGISILESPSKKSILFVISDLSVPLRDLIRDNLTSICYGAVLASRGSKAHSYQPTLREFMSRYDQKTAKIKKGMLGELLAHVLLLKFRPDMCAASPFFNLEEKSIKKGFDLVLYQTGRSRVWITEVKSGEGAGDSSKNGMRALLHRAKGDLNSRLNSANGTPWQNAIFGALVALEQGKVKDAILNALTESLEEAQGATSRSTSMNVVLISVLYKNLSDQVTLQDVRDIRAAIKSERLFKKVMAVAFQKGTFQKVEQFLKSELIP